MYVYGPVPSRRLGSSLGVSVIPAKTCSFSCVYCQLGRTNHLRVRREGFFPKEDILAEVIQELKTSSPDYVTFCGDGEPTLCRDLGWLVRQTKEQAGIPIAVITNGSLLYRKDVRQDLGPCDVVMASLDAGDERTFWTVNRPHGTLDLKQIIRGIVEFREEFPGQLWIEVMLVAGVNDSGESLRRIGSVVRQINPHRAHILTPIRPPAESWVSAPEASTIIEAQQTIEEAMPFENVESGGFGLGGFENARQAIIGICSRHPLRLEQARDIEQQFSEADTVTAMIKDGDLVEVEYNQRHYVLPAHMVRGTSGK